MSRPSDLSQFDYLLPDHLIAQEPPAHRTDSRLLHLDNSGQLHDLTFLDFPKLLKPHDLLIFNDTRVIRARLTGHKASGGKLEVLIERLLEGNAALAHVRSSRAPRPGTTVLLADGAIEAVIAGRQDALFRLQFDQPILPLLDQYGATPLPPYINRTADSHDGQRYQTVYAQRPGAVAAPTAGLHFDEPMLTHLDQLGVQRAFVTLHVGAGTFQPVRADRIEDHVMHAEWYCVPQSTLEQIQTVRQQGGRIVAVGTTSARALESAAAQWEGQSAGDLSWRSNIEGDTQLFITPGYSFKWVDALLTNFHLPQSTLLMMVSALAGTSAIQRAYTHAVAQRYRFFSYGDAMLIERPPAS